MKPIADPRYSEASAPPQISRFLLQHVAELDPEVIVLGGGLSKLPRLYRKLPACCAPHVFSDTFSTPILAPRHGDSSGVRGAAWLWPLPA